MYYFCSYIELYTIVVPMPSISDVSAIQCASVSMTHIDESVATRRRNSDETKNMSTTFNLSREVVPMEMSLNQSSTDTSVRRRVLANRKVFVLIVPEFLYSCVGEGDVVGEEDSGACLG